jgi:hypothetical protein
LIARAKLFQQVDDIPGDIVECGVFKGSGILTWLKLKKVLSPNAFKKVIGFDFFDTNSLIGDLNGVDKERMNDLFKSRNFEFDENYVNILSKIIEDAGFDKSDYELVKGNISNSAIDFVKNRPGFRISLLYLDLDL